MIFPIPFFAKPGDSALDLVREAATSLTVERLEHDSGWVHLRVLMMVESPDKITALLSKLRERPLRAQVSYLDRDGVV